MSDALAGWQHLGVRGVEETAPWVRGGVAQAAGSGRGAREEKFVAAYLAGSILERSASASSAFKT